MTDPGMPPGSDGLSHVHEPVLVQEVLAHLALERHPEGLVVDGTVGAGGHAAAILRAAPGVRLVGLDRDPEILPIAARGLEVFGSRFLLLQRSYEEIAEVLAEEGLDAPCGVLLDLGLSSFQLDDAQRGFSFRVADALPDMRFDRSGAGQGAKDLLDHAEPRELVRILREYGEEPRAQAVARAIVRARPIRDVGHLCEVVRRHAWRGRRHDPATRVFQALRIAVNDELGHLRRGLPAALEALAPGGRLVVLCFQSGEERLVKAAFREGAQAGHGRVLTRRPVRASAEEIHRNPRARAARLRAYEAAEAA
jgi:16S rRNA (cytosine1402-N4)-methyltransferase